MARIVVGAVLAATAVVASPLAGADPGQIPDLSRYTAVDVHPYNTYYNYPTTNGARFFVVGVLLHVSQISGGKSRRLK